MKNKIINIAILCSFFTYSQQFNVIINKHKYDTSEEISKVVYTDWIQHEDIYDCFFDKNIEDVYYNESFLQTEACNQDFSREKKKYKGEQLLSSEIEYKTETLINSEITLGTLLLNNCSQILNLGHSNGDGIYFVSTPKGNIDVLCDMTIDGGGWTLVSYGGDISSTKGAISGNISDRTNRSKLLIDLFGQMDANAPTTKNSFSRFDYFENTVKAEDEFLFKSTSSKINNMIIFPVVNPSWFGREYLEGDFTITSENRNIPYLRMTDGGDDNWKTVSNNTKWSYLNSSSDSYPGIDWNVTEGLNKDNLGLSYETALTHRSLIYWETNDISGNYTSKQWFHASSLTLRDSTAPSNNFRDAEFWYRED